MFMEAKSQLRMAMMVVPQQNEERPRTDSVHTYTSSLFETTQNEMVKIQSQSSVKEAIKLGVVCTFPIILVLALCVTGLLRARTNMTEISAINQSIQKSRPQAELAAQLARERGIRCQYILLGDDPAARETAKYIRSSLAEAEAATNQLLVKTSAILPPSFSDFIDDLQDIRMESTGGKGSINCSYILDWYSSYSQQLIEKASYPFVASGDDGRFWAVVYAYGGLLTAKDLIGLERALGSSFFVQGGFPPRTYIDFARYNGTADALISKVAFVLFPPSKDTYSKGVSSKSQDIDLMYDSLDTIFDNQRSELSSDAETANLYFNSVTTYINLVTDVESQLTDYMRNFALEELTKCGREYSWTLSLVIVAVVLSPGFASWYAWQSRKMLLRIGKFADQLRGQQVQLELERKKADLLLYQMIPKELASKVRQNQPVLPESFDEATVFFSDVSGFVDMVARKEPFEIVDLLNQLYTKMDRILDQYDAYKVETIADSYVVVSGVPNRNGRRHSNVICQMALNILLEMQTPSSEAAETIRLKIGICTGPLVAGIIGIRNQRYCLFGDTVNIASRMMSHGMASRIHISPATKVHLDLYHRDEFEVEERGPLCVKGKGTMVTYWLMKKHDFPYQVVI